nr:hypothetical protein [Mucilaginibacter segetis]
MFSTAQSERKDIQKASDLGVNDYLIKPFDDQTLLACVGRHLKVGMCRQAFYFADAGNDRVIFVVNFELMRTVQQGASARTFRLETDQQDSVSFLGQVTFEVG